MTSNRVRVLVGLLAAVWLATAPTSTSAATLGKGRAAARASWHAAWAEMFARCGPRALDRARQNCPTTGARHTVCGERIYRMRPLVDECGFRRAVEMALEDTHRGRFPAASAKVLWFEPGGDYLVDEPVVVEAPGIVFRGDGAALGELAEPDWRRSGTTFRCAVAPGQTCLTFERPHNADFHAGVRFEGIAMTWEQEVPPADDVVGLRIVNMGSSVIRSAQWRDFPGNAVVAAGVSYSRFEDLSFASETGTARTALKVEVGPVPDEGARQVGPNGNTIDGLRVQGYDYGVWYVGGNSVTLANASFVDSRVNALRLDGNESFVVRRVRFQDAQPEPSGDAAYVRVLRSEGWWLPDVTLSEVYFNCGCRPGRYPVAADVYNTSSGPVARVRIVGGTFRDCAEGVFLREDVRTRWQCSQNRVIQRVSVGPSVYESYFLDDCGDPAATPPHPEACE